MFDKHKIGKHSSTASEEPKVSASAPGMSAGPAIPASRVAMIGKGIRIAGEVRADCSLKIEGRVEGRSIQCSDEIEIAESGEVTAKIIGKVVKIAGLVSGDIGGSEKVLITRTGRVQGNIIAPRVQLEDGALFRGSIDMNPANPAAAEKPVAASQSATRPALPDSQKAAAASPSNKPASAAGPARKEPSLNLKSG